MRLWRLFLLPAVFVVLGGCTELVPVGYECPDRQRQCAPVHGPDAGLAYAADAAGDEVPKGGTSNPMADGGLKTATDGQIDGGYEYLIRNPSFEPVDAGSSSSLLQGAVNAVKDLLNKDISPWDPCLPLVDGPKFSNLGANVQVRSAPLPATMADGSPQKPTQAKDGGYFLQFNATPVQVQLNSTKVLAGFNQLTQPLARPLEAGETLHVSFYAAAADGNDEVWVQILGSQAKCATDAELELLYETPNLPDNTGWKKFDHVLTPTRKTDYIVITADTTLAIDFNITAPPKVFFDDLIEIP